MNQRPKSGDCIELRELGHSSYMSVKKYEAARRYARKISDPILLVSERAEWATAAPRVECLTEDWQSIGRGQVRISGREIYDQQMRGLIGIA